MKRPLHIVPGLDDPCNGIAVAAKSIAGGQDAALVDMRTFTAKQLADASEVWVHSMWMPQVWRACRAVKAAGRPLVRMTHANLDPVRLDYHGWKKRLVSPIERRLLRMTDKVVATCDAEAGWIRAYEPCVKRIEVVDLKKFFSLPKEAPPPTCDGKRPIHLLYMGRRHPLKGLDVLEAATKGLDGCELRIVSDVVGAEKEKVWEWCDVLVLPTVSENFGLVVAEALERGRRVVTTDGAPVWEGQPGVVYVKGFRAGNAAVRASLLHEVLLQLQSVCVAGDKSADKL